MSASYRMALICCCGRPHRGRPQLGIKATRRQSIRRGPTSGTSGVTPRPIGGQSGGDFGSVADTGRNVGGGSTLGAAPDRGIGGTSGAFGSGGSGTGFWSFGLPGNGGNGGTTTGSLSWPGGGMTTGRSGIGCPVTGS